MNGELVFIKRSKKEVEWFSDTVYMDVDSRNIGTLSLTENIHLDVSEGVHKIKMYKTHFDGSFIGFAEIEIDVKKGERLLVRYSPPMLATQQGNIIITEYIDDYQVDALIKERDRAIEVNVAALKEKENVTKKQAKKTTQNFIVITAIIIALSTLAGLIYWFTTMDALSDLLP